MGEFGTRLARAYEQWNDASGQVKGAAVPKPVRARLRTDLTRQMFAERHGRGPTSGSELAGFAARVSRRPAVPVAGYDLTFTPVKSVSALWAVVPLQVAQVVERAHADACADVLGWLERQAGYTRLGRDGVRQVQVRGLLAVAFTHRDSRAGDPNLHTHVAVSNKVQTLDGRWRALDGRPLHALATAASERYNTRLEALLVDRLRITFAERPGTPAGKRPVREVVGVDPGLLELWSSRRAAIDTRRSELAARFTAEHGRPPTPVEAIKLAQQATLETRQAKHQPRSYAEQRATWRADAEQALGGPRQVEAMLETLPRSCADPRRAAEPVSPTWVADGAQAVLDVVQAGRATWREAHVRAEAERLVRTRRVPLAQLDDAVERLVAAVLSPALSVPLGPPDPDASAGPAALRREDGSSVHTVAGSRLFTSAQVLAAEQQLLQLARRTDGRAVVASTVDRAVGRAAKGGLVLNEGQTAMVRELATSGRRVQLALAPAGTGKTTALRALAAAWIADGGSVLGLAPSAAAAAVLGAELADGEGPRVPADTLAKLLWSIDHADDPAGAAQVPPWVREVGPGSLVLIDEAAMAGTLDLARAVSWAVDRGASVRLIGDDAQLAAVGAGGVLRDLARTQGAAGLHDAVRFTDPAEGAASLALREGDPVALGFYLDRQRVHLDDPDGAVERAYTAWAADRSAGRDSVLLAPTRELVGTLNRRAREDRLQDAAANGHPVGPEVRLVDGSSASAGDRILTRRNDRRLVLSPTDWVKNGDRWTVTAVLPDGAVRAVHSATARRVLLPSAYVAEHVALGYASTIHTAQGSTADTSHTVLTGREDRQLLYVAATRGRTGNHLYLQGAAPGEEHDPPGGDLLRPPTPAETLTRILARDGAQTSATSAEWALHDPAVLLGAAVAHYVDSLVVAQRHEAVVGLPASVRFGPLPWLQAVPTALAADPVWGPHLQAQAERVRDLARQVDDRAGTWTVSSAPTWAAPLLATGSTHPDLVGRLAVWRAAQQVPDEDRRPAGPPARPAAERHVQDDLLARVTDVRGRGPLVGDRWRQQLDALAPSLRADPDWPRLAQRLAAAGHDLEPLVRRAVLQAPLPDELPAAALLWRLVPHLPQPEPGTQQEPTRPTVAVAVAPDAPLPARVRWQPLADAIDPRLAACPTWPLLAGALDRAQRAGHDVATRLPVLAAQAPLDDHRPARGLTARLVEECPAAALQVSAAARAADDRRRVQVLRSAGSTAPTHGPPATRTPSR